ncbi:unnamed protein product [Cercospora beticola]|nr:unnamed protein product [Cercospora beticola]
MQTSKNSYAADARWSSPRRPRPSNLHHFDSIPTSPSHDQSAIQLTTSVQTLADSPCAKSHLRASRHKLVTAVVFVPTSLLTINSARKRGRYESTRQSNGRAAVALIPPLSPHIPVPPS